MNSDILKHFEMKLLWEHIRVMDENGKIHDLYMQPERLNPKAPEFTREVCEHLKMVTAKCEKCERCDSPNTTDK